MLSPTQVFSRPNMQTVYNGNRFHGLIGRWIWLPYPLLTPPCRMLLKFRVLKGIAIFNMPPAILKLNRLNIINALGSLHSHHWKRFLTHQIFFQVGEVWRKISAYFFLPQITATLFYQEHQSNEHFTRVIFYKRLLRILRVETYKANRRRQRRLWRPE